jgi:hypothetical protein
VTAATSTRPPATLLTSRPWADCQGVLRGRLTGAEEEYGQWCGRRSCHACPLRGPDHSGGPVAVPVNRTIVTGSLALASKGTAVVRQRTVRTSSAPLALARSIGKGHARRAADRISNAERLSRHSSRRAPPASRQASRRPLVRPDDRSGDAPALASSPGRSVGASTCST